MRERPSGAAADAMRCLTLVQPHAGFVAYAAIDPRFKLRENRTRHMIRREDFGRPFAVHAGMTIDGDVLSEFHEHAADLFDPALPTSGQPWFSLATITGAIIAVATVDHVLDPNAHGIDHHALEAWNYEPPDQRRWCSGPIVYVLRDVRLLRNPVPHRGLQGFVRLKPDIERAVRAELP